MSSVDPKTFNCLGKTNKAERILLSLIVTHGFIVKSTWARLDTGRGADAELYTNAMWSLTRRKLVVARCLHHGKTYFALSPASVAKLSIDPKRGEPLAEKSKAVAYGRLLFFTEHELNALPVQKSSLYGLLGEESRGLPSGFYYRGKKLPLGFVRFDNHLSSAPIRSAQTLRHDAFRLAGFEQLRNAFKAKTFEFSWVTATQARANAVMKHFTAYSKVGKAPIRVCVYPELVPLICEIDTTLIAQPLSFVEQLASTNPNRSLPQELK